MICVYTVADVADILRVSTKTVYQLIREGDITGIRVRGQIRITSDELEKYLRGDSKRE